MEEMSSPMGKLRGTNSYYHALQPANHPEGSLTLRQKSTDEDLVRRWESRACRSVFSASLEASRPRFDAARGMLVPDEPSNGLTARMSGNTRVVRHVSWEDTLIARNVSIRPADGRLLDVARATCKGRPLYCEHAGVPLSLGTFVRPLRGIFHARNRSLFAVPIEKSASSSLKSLFGYRLLRDCPHATARQLFDSMAASTACEFAGTYAWPAAAERIALVRDPMTRFVTSLDDHGTLRCTHANCSLLQAARRRLREYREGPIEMRLFPPAATIHQYTQSYFLSGTDAEGAPVNWTRIIKLEDAPDDALPNRLRLPHHNHKPAYDELVALVRADAELRCGICEIYRQDFVCLGYGGCEGCT